MRYAFHALLYKQPAHGYELKQALESALGPGWPQLNFGQIYTTLSRLERDGLVLCKDVHQDGRPDKRVYELTPEGRGALQEWVQTPTAGPRLKDEFFMKMVLSRLSGIADPGVLIERQRKEYLQALKDLDSLNARQADAADPSDPPDPASYLLVEGAILHLQADLKWLDLCEEKLTGRKT
jgi:DNA-binding PadR family transcriptional regulator